MKDLSQPAANHQRLTLVFSFSELSAISFRRSGRMNARATDRGIIFFFFPSFSFFFFFLLEPESQLHPSSSSSLFIHFSLYIPPTAPSRHHPFLFLRVEGRGGGEKRDAPININGCGSFPLLSRTIYCLTSATADALLFAPEQRIAMLGRKEQQPRQRQKKDKIKRRKRLNKKIGKSQKRKRKKKKTYSCRRHTGKNKKKTTFITFRVPRRHDCQSTGNKTTTFLLALSSFFSPSFIYSIAVGGI